MLADIQIQNNVGEHTDTVQSVIQHRDTVHSVIQHTYTVHSIIQHTDTVHSVSQHTYGSVSPVGEFANIFVPFFCLETCSDQTRRATLVFQLFPRDLITYIIRKNCQVTPTPLHYTAVP